MTSGDSDRVDPISQQAPISRRSFTRRLFAIGGGAAVGIGLMAACAQPAAVPPKPAGGAAPTTPPAPQPTKAAAPAGQATAAPAAVSKPANQGGTLVAGGESIGENLMPAVAFEGWGFHWIKYNLYETLYTTRDFKTLVPRLATSHTVSPDGLVYTFQLRKGVKFHDGTPFNAEAVEFNYMRYLDKNHPYYDELAVERSALLPNVKSVKAKDEYTVEFVRSTPASAFVATLSYPVGGIVSPASVKKYGVKDVARHPVGTGPFVFEKSEKGNQASMLANEEYWGGRPLLDRIVVRQIADDQAMTASLVSGEIDMTPFVDFKDLAAFRKNPNLKVQVVPAASTGYMSVNQQHPTLKDARVRRAIAHAVNKQNIVDVIFYGEADIGAGLVPLPFWAYAPQLKDYYKHDPQKAKDLLKEAGTAPEIVLNCMTSGFWPRMAELIQADFSAVGLKTTIEKIETAKFLGLMTEGKQQVFLMDGTYSLPDPELLFWIFYGCENVRQKRWGWCDKDFDQLNAKQSAEPDQEKRKTMLWEMQKILLDQQAPLVNYYNRFATIMNKRVEGFVPMPIRLNYFETTYLTKK
ncbi:MAG: hypothetical protein HY331_10320 [Chloroflexi bacterium]|nr:hypothetical protein [Chloroflexota bacterium]